MRRISPRWSCTSYAARMFGTPEITERARSRWGLRSSVALAPKRTGRVALVAGLFFASAADRIETVAESRMDVALQGVGDEISQYRRELEGVARTSSGDDESWAFGVGRDPKVLVVAVAIDADP